MRVSYCNYRRMHEHLRDEIRVELETVLSLDTDSDLFEYQFRCEKEIARTLGKGDGIGVSCGTAAIQFSLTALGIGKNDEVITAANTYVATLLAISGSGGKPVLVDAAKETMLMDTEKLRDSITDKTKAIVPVHLYGQMANMQEIRGIAQERNLFVVEDACQAHLARYAGKLPGSWSDAACYSFFPNKNLGGIGNGGMAITGSRNLLEKIAILRNPTSNDPLVLQSSRTPAYLDWIQIAFIRCKLRHLKDWTERRREIAKMYCEGLAELPLTLPFVDRKAHHVYRDFAIRVKKRDKLMKYLRQRGIETMIHYPEPVHLTKTYRFLGYRKGSFPISEEICATILSLPVTPFLFDEEVQYVGKTIKSFF